MSEEKSEAPKMNQEEEVFRGLQNEFLQLCAQAGEKKYIISNLTKDLNKILFRIRKVDKKAKGMVDAKRLQEEAKRAALKIVPTPPEAPTAA